MRELRAALIAANKLQDFLEMGQEYFARAIDQRLAELPSRKITSTDRTAMAHALAAALLSLMSWWVDHGALASPEETDALYDRIVWSGVTAGSEAPSSGRCRDSVSLSHSLGLEHDTRECDRDRNTGRGRRVSREDAPQLQLLNEKIARLAAVKPAGDAFGAFALAATLRLKDVDLSVWAILFARGLQLVPLLLSAR